MADTLANTLCWHCDRSYPMARLFCPRCHYPNANHNMDATRAVLKLEESIADRDRRIEALVAAVDSWKASYMALAPDHDVAMLRANSRIEALTKALRELVEAGDEIEANAMDESSQAYIDARMRYIAAFHACKALASVAGAEGMG